MPSANKVKACRGRKSVRYFDGPADYIARRLLNNGEGFSHGQAYEFLINLKSRKALAHCKFRCKYHGIKLKRAAAFGQQPTRKLYLYKDIERFYTFADDPSILILGCADPEHNTSYYEFFQMNKQQIPEVCDLIEKARSNSDWMLTDEQAVPQNYYSSHSSLAAAGEFIQEPLNEINESRSDPMETDVQNLIDAASVNINYTAPENENNVNETKIGEQLIESVISTSQEQAKSITSEDIEDYDQYNNQELSPEVAPKEVDLNKCKDDPFFAKLCENMTASDLWAIDLKYIVPDSNYGNRISDTGGIYMFVAHHKSYQPEENSSTEYECITHKVPHHVEVPSSAEPEFTTAYF